jgi:large subunit ribosomal protein L13
MANSVDWEIHLTRLQSLLISPLPKRPNLLEITSRMKTFSAKAQDIQRKWYVIDAANRVLGDVAVHAAVILRGKNKAIFTSNVDCGDFVVIINADQVVLTGKKEVEKKYHWFTGFVGGHHETTPKKMRNSGRADKMVFNAVEGMIPHNSLGRDIVGKLRVYRGSEHPHTAQEPTPVQF